MSRSKIAAIIAALVLIAAAIIVIALKVGGTGPDERSPVERVRLEIRASEAATIVMNGKKLGTTPLSIYVAKTTEPTTLEASMEEHWAGRRGRPFDTTRKITKTIVPDHDQLIDFVPPRGPPPVEPD